MQFHKQKTVLDDVGSSRIIPAVITSQPSAEGISILMPWLQRVPIPIFGIGMGITGVGLCCHLLHVMLDTPRVLADAVLLFGALATLGAAVVYASKALLHPGAVHADWKDVAQAPFLSQVAITLLLMAEAAEARMPRAVVPLFAAGAGFAAVLAAALLVRWLCSASVVLRAALGPSWALPGIALLVVSALAPRFGLTELGWGFAGFAFAYFAVVGPALVTRLGTDEPLPERVRPTLAILMAVPSVALLALDGLTEGRWAADTPGLGTALMSASVVLGVVAAVALPGLVRIVPFGLPWWAYAMPPAALALALLVYGHATDGGLRLLPGVVLTLLLTLSTALLAVRTVAALLAGHLLPPRYSKARAA